MDRLPPFQYSLDAPPSPLSPTDEEVNQIIREDLLQLHTWQTWFPPELLVKLNFYRRHYLQISQEGFIMPQNQLGSVSGGSQKRGDLIFPEGRGQEAGKR